MRHSLIIIAVAMALATGAFAAGAQKENAVSADRAECDKVELRSCYQRALALATDSSRAAKNDAARTAIRLRALQDLTRICAAGLGDACYAAGKLQLGMVREGEDQRVLRESALLFQKACYATPPSAPGCTSLADAYGFGIGMKQHEDSALAIFLRACGLNNATGCYRASARLDGSSKDSTRVRQLADKACALGSFVGCVNRGVQLQHQLEGLKKESAGYIATRDSMRSEYDKACGRGVGIGCYNLGLSHLDKFGFPADTPAAVHLFHRACDGVASRDARAVTKWISYAPACEQLGILVAQKDGATPADLRTGIQYFQTACTLLQASACARQSLYESKLDTRPAGVFQFDKIASQLINYGMACFERMGVWCNNLGIVFENALHDEDSALRLYRTACGLNDDSGCTNAAEILLRRGSSESEIYRAKACRITKSCTRRRSL